jgi:DNA modification methylase
MSEAAVTPAWEEGEVSVYVGDALAVLRGLPSESIHCCTTSPPYWGLRDYGVPGQLGLEARPEEYIEQLVEIFGEVGRVLRRDGTLWLNLGDSYANDAKWGGSSGGKHAGDLHGETGIGRGKRQTGLKPKDLTMIPARVALALQADGWWLRSDVIWAKPNPMPESVTDRPTTSHEHLFLLARQERYYYDHDAVREPAQDWGQRDRSRAKHNGEAMRVAGQNPHGGFTNGDQAASGRNLRSVWTIATQPYAGAHFATWPEEIPRRAVLAGTSERGCCPECGAPWVRVVERVTVRAHGGTREMAKTPLNVVRAGWRNGAPQPSTKGWHPGCAHEREPVPCTVLDPFAGSGTTLAVAKRLGRSAVGIELQPDYLPLIRRRVGHETYQPALGLVEVTA